ncbi:MAG: guanylate kinase [Calditrichaeota bacterium]|nr:MAG: guanylate kinase [Calditrichota bacterium]
MNNKQGLLVVVSSPSGGGKTTVIKKILETDPNNFIYSVSMTTRPKRAGETEGKDYFFVTLATFQEHIRSNDLIEYEKVHDWYYGTPKNALSAWIKQGKVVLLDLDVYGGLHLKQEYGNRCLLIFLKPPSLEELISRLRRRSTESDTQIKRRLERLPQEMALADKFDAIILNENLDQTVAQVIGLIAEKRKLK